MSGVIVIVAYRPKPGKETELLKLVRNRVPTLCKEGLVTDREPIIMRARDGTIIEVSEWKSQEAIQAAHKNPNVLAMWEKFFAICDCVPLNRLADAEEMFAGFELIETSNTEHRSLTGVAHRPQVCIPHTRIQPILYFQTPTSAVRMTRSR